MEEKQDIFHQNVKKKIWIHSWLLALIIYILFTILVYYLDKSWSLLTFSKSLAGTAALMFGFSFSLSGFCYWWDFLDKKIAYRKQLGLVAYWLALAYSASLLIINPDIYLFGFWDNFWTYDILFGTTSMAIFTFLAIISTDKMMMKMGPKRWRYTLRLGYFAWLLLAFRAYFMEKEIWFEYLNTFQGFPPPRLLLSIYVIAIIVFRASIDVSKKCIPFTNKKIKETNK